MMKWTKKMMVGFTALSIGFAGVMVQESTPVEASSVKTYKTTDNLNLRTGGSVKYKRILTIPRGKHVQYVSRKGSWYKVKYASKTGYVSSSYLANSSEVSKKTKISSNSKKSGYVKKVMDVEVTAYTFRKGANRTASGKILQVGYVSAPREIPFGSIVDIPGIEKQLGVAELKVYDRGGAIKRLSSNKIRIDVAFPTRSGALKFGRKTYKNVPVYVKK